MATLSQTAPLSPAARPFLESFSGQAVLAVAASLFVAAFAHLSIPLPFTPVPLTLSDFAVVLVGLTLAPTTAFAALCLYLVEGAFGLPVFSQHGLGGIAQLRDLTGGFLLSYPLAAALTSSLSRNYRRVFRSQYTANVAAAALGSALLMLGGLCWFALSLHLTPPAAFQLATLPFLPGQLLKVLAAAGIVTSARALRRA